MISKSLSSIALASLALCGGAAQAVTTELIPNGSFSAGLTGWEQNLGGGTISVVDGAAKLVAGAGPADTTMKAANLAIGQVMPGMQVVVKFDAKGSWNAGGVAFVELFSEREEGFGASAQLLGGAPLFAQGKGNLADWTSFSFTQNLGPNVAGGVSLLLKSACGADAGCMATTYFDNVSITADIAPIPEPGTYALMLAGLAGVGALVRRRRAA